MKWTLSGDLANFNQTHPLSALRAVTWGQDEAPPRNLASSQIVIKIETFSEVCSRPETSVMTHNSLVALIVEREGLKVRGQVHSTRRG